MLEGGYTGFTFEAIAERAGTGKAVLYRRWPDKESLLLAVIGRHELAAPVEIPDTGSLRDDVLAYLRTRNRLGDNAAAVFSTVLGAYFDRTETTPAQLRARMIGDRSTAMEQIVQHAIERGEIASRGLPPAVVSLPFDLLRHDLIMTLDRVSDERIVEIVDEIFLPLATAS